MEYISHMKIYLMGFPGGSVVNNPPVNAGDTGSIPGLGRSHMPQINLHPCSNVHWLRLEPRSRPVG